MYLVEYDYVAYKRVLYTVKFYVHSVNELWQHFNAYCADPSLGNWRGDYPDEADWKERQRRHSTP